MPKNSPTAIEKLSAIKTASKVTDAVSKPVRVIKDVSPVASSKPISPSVKLMAIASTMKGALCPASGAVDGLSLAELLAGLEPHRISVAQHDEHDNAADNEHTFFH
jgi:hypothetical protein